MCGWQKLCDNCSSRTNQQNLTKLYNQCYPIINWFQSTFDANCSKGGAVFSVFQKFSGYADFGFQWMKSYKNLYTKYTSLEKNDAIWVCITQ